MPTARSVLAGAQVNGVVYAIGGYDLTGGFSLPVSNEAYDPVTNTWSTKAPMPTARYGLAAAAVNGIVYGVGGNNGGTVIDTMEAYDPVTNTWTTKAAMPTARWLLAAAEVNGIVYAIGGSPGGPSLNTVEAYNPGTNTWTAKAAMPTARGQLAAVEVNGIVYAIGGTDDGGTPLNTVEAYDPTTNTWSSKAAMPTARGTPAAAAVNGSVYVVGGATDASAVVATNEAFTPAPLYVAQVQQPIDPDGSSVFNVKRGVVPVKFTITQDGVATCQLPPATISLTRTAGAVLGAIDESTYLLASDSGSNFRIDTANCQYIYNLATSSLGTGTYVVSISIGGSVVGTATFGLK